MLLLATPAASSAQEWATKMFQTTAHDFGTVARGAKAEFKFELENIYEEDVHIASVRSSCGCTTPVVSKQSLKTWEKASVLAQFNTRSFLGARNATITVVFDQPFYAEIQLQVSGYIRSDVVFDPGEVNFGDVEPQATSEVGVEVNYAGRQDWQILDVRCANTNLEVELNETRRGGGRVAYQMNVRLKPDTPPGFLHDQLTIVTNDANMQFIPLPVHGHVQSPLTVSPATLFLGVLQPGQTVTKQLVVRAKQPFRVVDIKCAGDCFEFKRPADVQRQTHFVGVTFTAGSEPGEVNQSIEIKTDLDQGTTAQCTASATVLEKE
jgi:hypothetical protein